MIRAIEIMYNIAFWSNESRRGRNVKSMRERRRRSRSSRNRPSRRQRRSRLRRKVVDLDIIIEIEVEKGIDLVAGAIEGETAEIGSWIGM